MEVLELFNKRRSIRNFSAESVSQKHLDTLLHAAMSGPSAANRRQWEFYVVQDVTILRKLTTTSPYTNIKAPLAIIVCGSPCESPISLLSEYWIQDCSAATENILLCAAALGLGAVWCGVYPQPNAVKNIKEILQLPEKLIPLNIIYLGHPAEFPPARDQYDAAKLHWI